MTFFMGDCFVLQGKSSQKRITKSKSQTFLYQERNLLDKISQFAAMSINEISHQE